MTWEVRPSDYAPVGWQVIEKSGTFPCESTKHIAWVYGPENEPMARKIAMVREAFACLEQLHAAMKRYEQDAEDSAPREHRNMMEWAEDVLRKANIHA